MAGAADASWLTKSARAASKNTHAIALYVPRGKKSVRVILRNQRLEKLVIEPLVQPTCFSFVWVLVEHVPLKTTR